MSGDDIIIGKVSQSTPYETFDRGIDNHQSRQKPYRDQSIPLKHSEHGYIDQVMLTTTNTKSSNDELFVKVKMRTVKIPQIGDKFASRHG